MSDRHAPVHAGPTHINAFVTIVRTKAPGGATSTLASMAVVESRGPAHSTMGDLPNDGSEVVTDDGRWSLTELPVPAARAEALVILASATAHRASVLPSGPDRRRICREAGLALLLAAGLDGRIQ